MVPQALQKEVAESAISGTPHSKYDICPWLKVVYLGVICPMIHHPQLKQILKMAMAQNYQPPKRMVFLLNLLNMIISVGHWYHNFEPNPQNDEHGSCPCWFEPFKVI